MFDTMISKSLIQVIWILASLAVVIASVSTMFVVGGGGGFFLGIIYLVLGLAWVRVICEGMIILFVMNENLQSSTRSLHQLVESQNTLIARLSTLSASTPSYAAPVPAAATPRPASGVESPPQQRTESPVSTNDLQGSEEANENRSSRSRLGDWPTR